MAETPSIGRKEQFERDGFLHIRGFASPEECASLQRRMEEFIKEWDPTKTLAPVFVTSKDEQEKAQGSSDYFLDSADRIHFFLEKGAAGEDGALKPEVDKMRALNKVGHGLHIVDSAFRGYTHSDKVVGLVKELGWRDPVAPQSMYIFKQPVIGGEVVSHQDSTFLYTTPRQTCIGLWLALDAATLRNGCLWARPGSHREPVRRKFVRNPAHFGGDKSKPQMIFEGEPDAGEHGPWEGVMPEGWEPPSTGLYDKGFKPVECEVGDLVVIHGQVDHLSLPNTSDMKRETFQLHLVEGPAEGIEWSSRNWLQYPGGKPFPRIGHDVEKVDSAAGGKRKAGEVSEVTGDDRRVAARGAG
mmetsp:Transcript_139699/g.260538  ORF Transcript_139699/g.260538 Transcript_139699/m.260538 type:complete len:356 (-) Transcript_139699:13-1080(-)